MKRLLLVLASLLTTLAIAQRFVQTTPNIAGLVTLNPLNIHSNVFVAGQTNIGDGGGGVYIYDISSTRLTNADLTVLKPLNYNGRWIRTLPNLSTGTNSNGSGPTYITTYITTNVDTFITTNTYNSVTNLYQSITNVTIQNIIANNFQQGGCSISGTNPAVNWTNCFLSRWTLSGDSFPFMQGVPQGTNIPSHEVDVVQPIGAAYSITWGDNIYWPYGTNYLVLPQDTTNKFHFQWNGESLRGWLVDGPSSGGSSSSSSDGLLVQVVSEGVDSIVQGTNWANVDFGSGAFSVTITNNGPYAVFYTADFGANDTQIAGSRLYDGTNTWIGTEAQRWVSSADHWPVAKVIVTNITTAPVTLTLQTQSSLDPYANNLWLVSTNNVIGYHSISGATDIAFANPTGMIGLSGTNGVSTFGMRSDASPPLDQGISPIWTAIHNFQTNVAFGVYVTLGGTTNRLTDTGTALTYNGTNISSGISNLTPSYVPYATSATTLGDSPIIRAATNIVQFGSSDVSIDTTSKFAVLKSGSTPAIRIGGAGGMYLTDAGAGVFSISSGSAVPFSLTTSDLKFQKDNVGSAIGSGIIANNSYMASAGAQQNSPSIKWVGEGFSTVTNVSMTVQVDSVLVPIEGAAVPSIEWRLQSRIGNVPWQIVSNMFVVTSLGEVRNGGVSWFHGTGDPEGVVTAPIGSFYSREDGGAGTSFYVHEATGNTNWVAK